MNISITADKVNISLSSPAPEVTAGIISALRVQQPGELEWSETLCKGKRVDYASAEAAVKELGEGWRLPTRAELLTLVDLSRHEPAIDTDKYPDTKSDPYWTSSECAWNKESARWVVHFLSGYVGDGYVHYGACIRAVRASQ